MLSAISLVLTVFKFFYYNFSILFGGNMKKVRLLKDAVLDDEECEKVKNQDKQEYELLLAVSNSLKNKIVEKIKAARERLRD